MDVELSAVPITNPEVLNVIIGQAHFIKAVEDLHEALAGASPHLRFGIAFCEASGPRLIRRSGNADDLVDIAVRNAEAVGAGHSFVVFLREGFPVNVLNALKAVPEVCTVYCATANSVESSSRRPIAGEASSGSSTACRPRGSRPRLTRPTANVSSGRSVTSSERRLSSGWPGRRAGVPRSPR